MSQAARREAKSAADSTSFRALARSGYAASGLTQALVGVLAIQVAVRGGGQQTDQSGALESLTNAPGGAIVVWLVAVAGLALALWLIVDGCFARGHDTKERWGARLKSWGKAVVYGAVGVTALRVVLGGGAGSSTRSSRQGASTLLGLPGGQVLLVVLGLIVIAIGGALVYQGLAKRFLRTIRVPSGDRGRTIVLLGRVGYCARGIAIAVVGVLFIVAAVRTDPNAAGGLDGALRSFAGLPFGRVILALVGAGWIASGVYSVARARLAKLD